MLPLVVSLECGLDHHLAVSGTTPHVIESLVRGACQLQDFGDRFRKALPDRYRIIREIGRGGMSVVFLAHDRQYDRDVAIKALRPELALAGQIGRFLQEIQITARLTHPHILALHDSGDADGILYYVSPYIEGGSLRDRLRREGPLPLPDVIELTRQIAEALDHAHDVRFTEAEFVAHRDVKPENVLLAPGGHALLADFGIARIENVAGAEKLSEYGLIVGTLPYMSPEQCAGERTIDRRTDVYALGCVVYEMLVGEPPFTGPSNAAISAKHLHERPPSLRVVRPDIPEHVQTAVERALAKMPADRFATAAEFGKALAARAAPVTPGVWKAVAAAAAFALAGWGAWGAWGAWETRVPSLDENKVVVFPLTLRGGQNEPGRGDEVALLIGSALEHTEPLRWIDGWTWLDSAERANTAVLSAAAARSIADHRHARYYIDGSILVRRDSGTVILRLFDVAGDSLIAQASASAHLPTMDFPQLGLRAVRELLPRLLQPGRAVDLRVLSERNPAAVALWLQGEREYRRSQFGAALDRYRRALDHDSNLAFAAVKAAQAASWSERADEATAFLAVALRHQSELPRQYAEFAQGLSFYLGGSADSAVARYRQAIGLVPGWSEAWMALGEVYYHLLPAGSPLDSLAKSAFLAARSGDREFAPPLYHLVEITLREGDVESARAYTKEFLQGGPDSTIGQQLLIMVNCVEHGAAPADWEREARRDARAVALAGRALAIGVSQPQCAEGALRAVIASGAAESVDQWGAILTLQSMLLAQGRLNSALALLDSSVTTFPQVRYLYLLDAAAGFDVGERAELALPWFGPSLPRMVSPRLWAVGIWMARVGDVNRLRSIGTILSKRADSSSARVDRLIAETITAHVAMANGDTADAYQRLARLRASASRVDLAWDLWESLAGERLQLAELMLKRGNALEAYRVATEIDSQVTVVHLLFLPWSLDLRRRAAEAMGRQDLARRITERLYSLHQATTNL
ncbi:MAG: protein kinase [Gemmatimonadetes bacterium]|nr:protein kinase [Gemmatimonadota bacterium]